MHFCRFELSFSDSLNAIDSIHHISVQIFSWLADSSDFLCLIKGEFITSGLGLEIKSAMRESKELELRLQKEISRKFGHEQFFKINNWAWKNDGIWLSTRIRENTIRARKIKKKKEDKRQKENEKQRFQFTLYARKNDMKEQRERKSRGREKEIESRLNLMQLRISDYFQN